MVRRGPYSERHARAEQVQSLNPELLPPPGPDDSKFPSSDARRPVVGIGLYREFAAATGRGFEPSQPLAREAAESPWVHVAPLTVKLCKTEVFAAKHSFTTDLQLESASWAL